MRTLEEINEKLYSDISRLHRYEEFMDAKNAEEVAQNIFEEYRHEVELYKKQRELAREKSMYEIKSLTRALKPRSILGMFKSKTAKISNAQLAEIEKQYCDIFTPSGAVYEALDSVMREPDEDAAAEPEAEKEPTEATAENAAAEPKEAQDEDEEVIIDDEEEEAAAAEPESEEAATEGTEPTTEPKEPRDGDGASAADEDKDEPPGPAEEETEEAKENGEVHQSGKSE